MRRLLQASAICGLSAWVCFGSPLAWAADQTADSHVTTTIIRGGTPYPTSPTVVPDVRTGDVRLNFPAVDVRDLAKAVLGDLLGKTYSVAPSASGSVTLVTDRPIARADVLLAFENALRASNLALIRQGGSFLIAPIGAASGQAPPLTETDVGYGAETIQLRFVAAAELKAMLDPILPGTVSIADAARNVVTITGSTGQRKSVRDLIAQFDTDWLKGTSFALYVPHHTDSRILAPEIDKLLNGAGSPSAGLVRLIVMDRINGILAVSAQPQYLDDVKRWLEVLDREGESSEPRLFVYRVQNGRSADLATVLNSALGNLASHAGGSSSDQTSRPAVDTFDTQPSTQPLPAAKPPGPTQADNGGRDSRGAEAATAGLNITSDETNNAVLVYGTPRQYAVVEEALRQLDITPLQVLIDAVITEVDLTHNLQFGVQFSVPAGHNVFSLAPNPPPASATTTGDGTTPVTPTIPPGFTWLVNYGSIQASLNALSALTRVNVLSAPEMMVVNNHTASLDVGDQVPIVTASSTSTIGTNAPTVNSVDYRDTGVILKVTPRVNASGLVLLDIDQEVSDVATTSTSTINSPTIQQRKFSTSIAVQDGQTVALGGLIRDNTTKGRSGVPFLNAIPIIGWLAGQQLKTEARTELIILLTPRVIRSASDADAVTEELRRKIQSIPPLKPMDFVPAMTRAAGDDGYAIVAAVGALALFASVSYAILAADRGDISELRGQFAQARLEASAEAGLTQAIEGLATDDVTRRWPIDGRVQTLSFNGDKLSIAVEDERGKAPYAGLSADELRRLFSGAGVPDSRIQTLVDAYQDWFDPDADPTRHAAELAQYAARGITPPSGAGDGTLDELARLNGMDAVTFVRIRAVLTPYFGNSGAFSPKTASPLAIATMSDQGEDDTAVLEREHELAGERPAIEISDEKSMTGHAVTVDVRVDGPDASHLERRTVVEFTGKASPAFYVREIR